MSLLSISILTDLAIDWLLVSSGDLSHAVAKAATHPMWGILFKIR